MGKLSTYVVANAKDVHDHVKNGSVDVVITSPPYWNLKDYGEDNQIGFGQKYEEYLSDLVDILDGCKHVLKDNGSMWIVVDSFKKGGNVRLLPFEISKKLQDKGWHLQDVIIWQKDKTLPWTSRGKLRNIFEYVLFFTKGEHFNYFVDELRELDLKKWWVKYPERYNPKGKVPSRVWDISIPVQGGWGKSWVRHFCPFPPLLVEKILLLTTKTGDLVLDPFAGSGSVLAQSEVMGRRAIGLDLNLKYKEMYKTTVLPFYEKNWENRAPELKANRDARVHIERTILSLRRLKFPAYLAKKILDHPTVPRNSILGILHEGGIYDNPKYSYIVSNEKIMDVVRKLAVRISSKAPFTKYGFTPEFDFVTVRKLPTRMKHQKYYLYRNGVTNVHIGRSTLGDALMLKIGDKIPPVLSDLRAKQETEELVL